ncbi:DUF5937 family protein [Kitasatospora cineracea]
MAGRQQLPAAARGHRGPGPPALARPGPPPHGRRRARPRLARRTDPARRVVRPRLPHPRPHHPGPDPGAGTRRAHRRPRRPGPRRPRHPRHHQGPPGPRARALHADPPAALPRLAQEIRAYWESALAPYWPRIRALLDADVFHRTRQLARHGTGRTLNTLHPQISWDSRTLHLARRARTLAGHTSGTGLLLVPTAFKGPGLSTRIAPPDPPQLAYRARAVGDLWQPRGRTTAATAAVLGRARALLLAELDTPATTTELAHRTGLSPAHVSQNLTTLRDAGFVTAHRTGRSVLYARTAVAEAVLDAGR